MLQQIKIQLFLKFVFCCAGRAATSLAAVTGGSAAVAFLFLVGVEGKSNTTYIDTAGVPTICYGHTQGVKRSQTLSDAQCTQLLRKDLGVALAAVDAKVQVPLPDTMRAALGSFVFNVGAGAFADSTLLKLLNQSEYESACHQMRRWICEKTLPAFGDTEGPCVTKWQNKRVSKGLLNRREKEIDLCLNDL